MPSTVSIVIKAKDQASAEVEKVKGSFTGLTQSKGFQSVMQGVGMGAGIQVWGMVAQKISQATDFIKGSVTAASDLNETMNKSSVVFGQGATSIATFGETAAASLGMSTNMAVGAAAGFGNLFKSMGMSGDASADMSIKLVKLAADLASFNNIDPSIALDKLRSGLVGETEPMRQLGVLINEQAVSQKAYAMGLAEVGAKLTEGAKVQARYALIVEQTATAQGDFARTADGMANQQRILAATTEDLQAKIGTKLLPIQQKMNQVQLAFLEMLTDTAEKYPLVEAGMVLVGIAVTGLTLKLGAMALAWAATPMGQIAIVAAATAALVGYLVSTQVTVEQLGGTINTESYAYKRYRATVEETGKGVAATTADMAASVTSNLHRIPNAVAQSFQALPRKTIDLLDTMNSGITSSFEETTKIAAAAGTATVEAFTTNLADLDEIEAGMDDLNGMLARELSRGEAIARLGGLVVGKGLTEGLASGNKDVYEKAVHLRDLVASALADLGVVAVQAGIAATAALAQGLSYVDEAMKRTGQSAESVASRLKGAVGDMERFLAGMKARNDIWPDIGAGASAAADKVKAAAQRIKDAIGDAFDRADKSAKAFFDSMHARNLRAIDDARRLSDAQFEAQIGAVDAEVQAMRDALAAKRDARREAELRMAVDTAETIDERAAAEQALSDFLEDQELARAEKAADLRIAELRAQQDAANARFDAAKQAEDDLYAMKVAAWEKASEALQASLDKQTVSYGTAAQQVLALLAQYKGDYAAVGHALGAAFGDGMTAEVTAAGTAVIQAAKFTFDQLRSITDAALAHMQNLVGTPRPGGGGRISEEEAFAQYTKELTDSGAYFYDPTPSGGWRVTPTGMPSLSAQGLAGGGFAPEGWSGMVGEAGPERLTMLRGGGGYVTPNTGPGGSPVVIALQVDGRTLAEVVDRNLFYTYRTSARGA